MIAIGADHGGYKLKEKLKEYFINELKDYGAYNEERGLEEPEVALKVANAVRKGECEAGILICRSGIGMAMAANKVKGIRCGIAYNNEVAVSLKEHNNANIIALGSDYISIDDAINMIKLWKNATFLGGIYKERLDIVENYESEKE